MEGQTGIRGTSVFVFRSDRFPGEALFAASSLESNDASWHLPPHHPANTSTAPLQFAPLHPSPSSPPAKTYALSQTHTHTTSLNHKHTHSQAQKEMTCPTQTANKGSVKRMCLIVAFVYAHCLGFCLVAFLLYPQTKRRISKARKNRTPSFYFFGCFFFFCTQSTTETAG